MRFTASLLLTILLSVPLSAFAASDAVTRLDGFLMIWRSISRPAETAREKPYSDVPPGSPGFLEITYAKARGLLSDEEEAFRPDATLSPHEALLWVFRTRSVEPITAEGERELSGIADSEDVAPLAVHYTLQYEEDSESLTSEELRTLMRSVDQALASEEHEVSLYSEKFHGKGTAFGEGFDMNALTAAHRTFPHNTLVRVTNIENGKSVTVRINDRGPFVQGRDMDLSLRSFSDIAPRSKGKIMARFERLGDSNLVQGCGDNRAQQRITKSVSLTPGIPHRLELGNSLTLTSREPFVVRDIIYPDGFSTGTEVWVTSGETFELSPSLPGLYRFMMGTKEGRRREMRMEVVDCT